MRRRKLYMYLVLQVIKYTTNRFKKNTKENNILQQKIKTIQYYFYNSFFNQTRGLFYFIFFNFIFIIFDLI